MSDFGDLAPWLRPYAEALIAEARKYGSVRVTSVSRTYQQQAYLYRQYLAGRARYPAAPPGTSYHEYNRAFDVKTSPALLEWMGRVWESWGGTWGARFGDSVHFQA